VDYHPKHTQTRRDQIAYRLVAIRERINDLQRPPESRLAAPSGDRLVQAQDHAADSRAAAHQALVRSIEGLLQAARAHERCAISHERLAAAPDGDEEHHRQRAARHRAAAAADRQRADRARALLPGPDVSDAGA
jgi:hypothetical protein